MLFQVLIAKEYKRENYLKLSHKYLQAFLKTDTNHPKGNHTLIISNFHIEKETNLFKVIFVGYTIVYF